MGIPVNCVTPVGRHAPSSLLTEASTAAGMVFFHLLCNDDDDKRKWQAEDMVNISLNYTVTVAKEWDAAINHLQEFCFDRRLSLISNQWLYHKPFSQLRKMYVSYASYAITECLLPM